MLKNFKIWMINNAFNFVKMFVKVLLVIIFKFFLIFLFILLMSEGLVILQILKKIKFKIIFVNDNLLIVIVNYMFINLFIIM